MKRLGRFDLLYQFPNVGLSRFSNPSAHLRDAIVIASISLIFDSGIGISAAFESQGSPIVSESALAHSVMALALW